MDKPYFIDTGISPWTDLNSTSDHSFYEPTSFDSSNDAFSLRGPGNFNTFVSDCSSSLNSPNKLILPSFDLGNSVTLAPPLPPLSADPGFAERAAKFSCFGSRSFNGRISQLGQNGSCKLGVRSDSPSIGNGTMKLSRVLSSPALRLSGSNTNSSIEDSSVSNEMNSRKRKAVSRGKNKEDRSNSAKGVEGGDAKRSKSTESAKIEEETRGCSNDERGKQKSPPEPPKDYIHVRARRGQATDSHSLAERVRREKISERMKLLQDLVPGCNKVTGKALMLDEIINYVQSLQHQVEFLSMKLSSVNPSLDVDMGSLLSKDMIQQNAIMYPLDSSSPAAFYHPNVQQMQHDGTNITSQCHLPCVDDGFNETLSQLSCFNEDDLQSIVQMGFVQNLPNFPGNMKVER